MSNLLYDPIKAHSKLTNEVLVSFSTGKDSIVTLDLCNKYFDKVVPFFMYLVPGLEFQERTLQYYEKRYNQEILRLPHPDYSLFLRYGTYRPFDLSVPEIKFNDVYDYVRRETGIIWITAGERITDSIVRRAMIKHSGTTDFVRHRFFTVANWRKRDILEYIRFNKLLLAEDSRNLGMSFGDMSGQTLATIKKVFPKDYEKIRRIFPLCETAVKRYEYYGY